MIQAPPGPAPAATPAAGYRPVARRPIATVFRRTAESSVRACLRLGISADAVSWASLGAAVAAALCFWQSGPLPVLLVPAVGFCYLRLWLNMLDGMVALAAGTASPRGELLNEGPDRVSDVLIFAGVAHSGLVHVVSGYWAAIFALLAAYVGTLGQAVGAGRQFGGVMSKPWRMVTLHAGAWLTLAQLAHGGPTVIAGLSVLDWTCLVIVAGCVQTIGVRLAAILRALRAAPHPDRHRDPRS
jgi:phosphatidylglycerophosphate synthase